MSGHHPTSQLPTQPATVTFSHVVPAFQPLDASDAPAAVCHDVSLLSGWFCMNLHAHTSQTALERQDLSCKYLALHELESSVIIIVIIIIILIVFVVITIAITVTVTITSTVTITFTTMITWMLMPQSCVYGCRQVERVHAAVLGAHERHACLLPLEMYLEEAIPLVCYIRDLGHAQMVELPEQSCHAFISFANAQGPEPSLKVASKH